MSGIFSFFPNCNRFEAFKHFCLKVNSESLKDNPLGDPSIRFNHGLLPAEEGHYTTVLVLSGFTSNGAKNFNFKGFEQNLAQELDQWTLEKALKPHIYVFVEAWTLYGGSQFINSEGCGQYEDYIVRDLIPTLKSSLPDGYGIKDFALLGGSSGGYGVLHLSSKHPQIFPQALSIAPDSDFEMSLKPELYHALYHVKTYGGLEQAYAAVKEGELDTGKGSFHQMINAMAMAACYSKLNSQGIPEFPVNDQGELDQNLWSSWLEKDPLYFLKERSEALKSLNTLFLTVGKSDQFLLQYGTRKIHRVLNSLGVEHIYEEFEGDHFDIKKQRRRALSIL